MKRAVVDPRKQPKFERVVSTATANNNNSNNSNNSPDSSSPSSRHQQNHHHHNNHHHHLHQHHHHHHVQEDSTSSPVDSCYSITDIESLHSSGGSSNGSSRSSSSTITTVTNAKISHSQYYGGGGGGSSRHHQCAKVLGCLAVCVIGTLVLVFITRNNHGNSSNHNNGLSDSSSNNNGARSRSPGNSIIFTSSSGNAGDDDEDDDSVVKFDYNDHHQHHHNNNHHNSHHHGDDDDKSSQSPSSPPPPETRVPSPPQPQPPQNSVVSEYVHLYKLPPPLDNDDLSESLRNKSPSQQQHHHRFKTHDNSRHHYYNTGVFRPPKSRVWDPHPQYIFHAFNRRFHLVLNQISRKQSLLVPGFKVTTHSNDDQSRETWTRRGNAVLLGNGFIRNGSSASAAGGGAEDEFEGCFYNGFVLGEESSVAVSLCSGMTGHIRTSTGSYFIEPRRFANDLEHVIYQIVSQKHDDHLPEPPVSPKRPPQFPVTTTKNQLREQPRNHGNSNSSNALLHKNLRVTPYDYYEDEDYDSTEEDEEDYEDEEEEEEDVFNHSRYHGNDKNKSRNKLLLSNKFRSNNHQQHQRSKRSLSTERYVELTVVTDQTMSRYHGDNLKHYVLTLLSIVALVYRDASIGNPVNIVLVNFHVLTDTDFSGAETGGNGTLHGTSASEMLRNFCKWQKEHNHPDDRHALHHDTALLLTRETICRNPWAGKCDTLGLAELGTMCDLYASCAIVQDNGLSAAFTITHELGHVMNMPHDDDYKCQGFIDTKRSSSSLRGGGSDSTENTDFDDEDEDDGGSSSGGGSSSSNNSNGSSNGVNNSDLGGGSSSNGGGSSRGDGIQHFVMSRMLDHNTYPWAWSRCSRHFLTEFLDAGHGYCLEDKPDANLLYNDDENSVDDSSSSSSSSSLLSHSGVQQPGEIFSEHKQCELVFGPNSQLCSYMPPCRRLWCTNHAESEESEGCRTQHMPWADGTRCGANKWCQRGACVLRDLEKLKVINGGWGGWQDYGECSRVCGGGVRKSYRECDNPKPRNGGKYCVGPRVRYESCNTFECPQVAVNVASGNSSGSSSGGSGTLTQTDLGFSDFRGTQCGAYDGDNFNIHGLPDDVVWVPKYNGISPKDRCKLFCRVQGSSSYYLLKEKVIDGTPCAIDTFDVCVNGACLPAGCDRRLHSTKTLDICGVCGGDGSTCTTSQGSYNSTKYGYNSVVRIPAGASNIDIRQRSYDNTARDDNYLALIDPLSNEYVLNGHFVVSMFRKTLHFGGSVLEYSGSDQIVERINSSSRPIKRDLEVRVLSVGKLKPPDIVFQYVISSEEEQHETDNTIDTGSSSSHGNQHMNTPPPATFEWVGRRPQNEQTCSSLCSGVTLPHNAFDCVRVTANGQAIANPADCAGKPKPPHRPSACNTHCTIRYKLSCPENCVNARNHTTECVRTLHSTNTTQRISERYCVAGGVDKPDPPDCVSECRNRKARWRWTQWSECTYPGGSRCSSSNGGGGSNKNGSRNAGSQQRNVWCQRFNWRSLVDPNVLHDNYEVVSDSECEGEKPASRRSCRMPSSSGICGEWNIDEWSPCSTTCGPGRTRALYACVLKTHSNTQILPPGYCLHDQKPIVERPCEVIPCASYSTTNWSACECTANLERRNVTCLINGKVSLDDRSCVALNLPRPESTRSCLSSNCVVEYRVSNWSGDCRLFNGKYYRYRSVSCDGYLCSGVKPESMLECGEWRVESGWSGCNGSCSVGVEVRAVVCYVGGVRSRDEACDGVVVAKPVAERKCYHNCGGVKSLRMGGRGEEGFGGGVGAGGNNGSGDVGVGGSGVGGSSPSSTNSYYYYNINNGGSGGISSSTLATTTSTTPRSVVYKWVAGAWGKCTRMTTQKTSSSSVACGPSTSSVTSQQQRLFKKHRQVKCVAETSTHGRRMTTIVPTAYCSDQSGRVKPDTSSNCTKLELSNLQACPVWVTGDWSPCTIRPNTEENCAQGSNNVTILRGLKTRTVACVQDTDNATILNISACGDEGAIEIEEKCVVKATAVGGSSSSRVCTGISYSWKVGNWSQCAMVDGSGGKLKCGGKGRKTRTVECWRTWRSHITFVDEELCVGGSRKGRGRRAGGGGRRPRNARECSRTCKSAGAGKEGRVTGPTRVPPFKWVLTEWSNCSKPCGYGLRSRRVTCHRTNLNDWVDPDALPTQVPSVNNTLTYCAPPKPKEYDYCMISETCDDISSSSSSSNNDSSSSKSQLPTTKTTKSTLLPTTPYSWNTSEYSPCGCPDGDGNNSSSSSNNNKSFSITTMATELLLKPTTSFQKRKVFCANGRGDKSPARHCPAHLKPKRKRRCECNVFRSCAEVRDALVRRQLQVQDGEYTISVGGKVGGVSMWCHGMTDMGGSPPKEYVTLLNEDTNYSEVYDKRLIRPETCPRNGSRLTSCECVNDKVRRVGLTRWKRVRVNVTNLRVDVDDFTFAYSTQDLIGFGTAGDCYSSSMACPQGRFSIDFRNTGLAVSSLTSWTTTGHRATMRVVRKNYGNSSSNGSNGSGSNHLDRLPTVSQFVQGKCGGYCGTCAVSRAVGLRLDVV